MIIVIVSQLSYVKISKKAATCSFINLLHQLPRPSQHSSHPRRGSVYSWVPTGQVRAVVLVWALYSGLTMHIRALGWKGLGLGEWVHFWVELCEASVLSIHTHIARGPGGGYLPCCDWQLPDWSDSQERHVDWSERDRGSTSLVDVLQLQADTGLNYVRIFEKEKIIILAIAARLSL
jgi:hypothetical protein